MIKKFLHSIPFIFILFFIPIIGFAQPRQISGRVIDGVNNAPLNGATVSVKGTGLTTLTNEQGNFTLTGDFKATDVLEISFVGYVLNELRIGDQNQFQITLKPDNETLGEVIVTGVAAGTPKTKLGFSIDKINAERLQKVPGTDPAAALQGKVAGVKINKTSGTPGSESDIQLRGVKTIFGSSNPLIIVDGILTTGRLSDINAQDIQSIEILKGAAASSLYGSRAANGVISIISKRGNSMGAGKTEISFRSEVGQNFMGFIPEKSLATNRIVQKNPITGELEVTRIGAADQIVDNLYPQTYDNLNQFFNPGKYITNYISFKGNSNDSRISVYSSVETTNEAGVVKLVKGFNRTNFKLNLDYRISDKIDFTTSNLFAQSESDNRASGAFGQLMNTDPNANLYETNEDGSPYKVNVNTIAQASNPLYNIVNSINEGQSERLLSFIALKYRPLNFLSFEASYGTDRIRSESFFLSPKGRLDYNLTPSKGSIFRGNSIGNNQTVQVSGSYFKKVNNFNTRFKAQYIYQ